MSHLKSNKTLKPSIKIPGFITLTAKILQFFSHSLTVRFADKLFTTPIGYPTPKREKTMEESAQKKSVFIPSLNKNIHVLSYGYSKRKVLFAHGWAGRSTQLFMLADKLLENGYMIISFDGPAHGKSEGKRTNMPEFLEALKVLTKEYGPFEAAIGHSFGGMSLYNSVSRAHLDLKCMVTIGAADTVTNVLKNFTKSLKVKPVIAKKMQHYYEKNWSINLDDFAPEYVSKNISIPTLIVHDSYDGDVPVSSSTNIRQNLQNGTLLITKGLGHTKILRDKGVAHKVVDFIKSHT